MAKIWFVKDGEEPTLGTFETEKTLPAAKSRGRSIACAGLNNVLNYRLDNVPHLFYARFWVLITAKTSKRIHRL